MLINIYRHIDSVKVVYKLRDSVNYKSMFKDKRYNELKKYAEYPLNIKTSLDSMKEIYRKLDSIDYKYTFYSEDSLLITSTLKPLYTKLLDDVVGTSSDSLENKEANKARIVFDGTIFEFKIKNRNTERIVNAQQPNPKSHPILYQLLKQTLELYRRTKINAFLSFSRTDNY